MQLLDRFGRSRLDKILTIILILAILGATGMLSYILAMPQDTGEKFTEFYILGLEDKATDYTKELQIGDEGRVIAGIVNHEYQRVSYTIEIVIDGAIDKEIGPIVLEHGEKWQGEVSFTPIRVGVNQKIQFLLYDEEKSFPKEELYLWIDAKESE